MNVTESALAIGRVTSLQVIHERTKAMVGKSACIDSGPLKAYLEALVSVTASKKVLQISDASWGQPIEMNLATSKALHISLSEGDVAPASSDDRNDNRKSFRGQACDLGSYKGTDLRSVNLLVIAAQPSYPKVYSILSLYRQFLAPGAVVVIRGIKASSEVAALWREMPFPKVEVVDGQSKEPFGLVQVETKDSRETVDFFRLRMALFQRPKRKSFGPLDGYATHYPILAACVARTKGAVLELGCGNYSTPMLHLLCRNRKLVSLDSSPDWLNCFSDLAVGDHEFRHVQDWDDCPTLDEGFWDVAFVDHAPPERRLIDIRRLMHRTRYLVVHDTEDPCYLYESVFPEFKYRYDYTVLDPWTTVLSNFEQFVP